MQLFPLFIYLFILLRRGKSQHSQEKTLTVFSLVDLNVEKCFRFVSISVAVLFFLFFFFFRVKGWQQQQQQHTVSVHRFNRFSLCVCVSSFSL